MTIIGLGIQLVGFIIAAICALWIAILAFQESVWWGLGCLFVPFVGLIFAIMYWQEAKKPFLIQLDGGWWRL
jgi:FtsH-binding integral membrane protein